MNHDLPTPHVEKHGLHKVEVVRPIPDRLGSLMTLASMNAYLRNLGGSLAGVATTAPVIAGAAPRATLGDVLREADALLLREARDDAVAWLRDNDREPADLINVYVETRWEAGDMVCRYTFGDRDTAMLFRLWI